MKIEVEYKPFAVKFKDLQMGDVFKIHEDYYMKMEEVDRYNSVNLDNGELKSVYDETVVVPIDATLMVGEQGVQMDIQSSLDDFIKKFDDIFCGDVFMSDNEFYIKMAVNISDCHAGFCNSVNIKNGTVRTFQSGELVLLPSSATCEIDWQVNENDEN